MEKGRAHYALVTVKAHIGAGTVRITISALAGAAALGLDLRGVLDVIRELEPTDLYKSMTTIADHRIWQDVYHKATPAGYVYLKLTVVDGLLIVSFKEL